MLQAMRGEEENWSAENRKYAGCTRNGFDDKGATIGDEDLYRGRASPDHGRDLCGIPSTWCSPTVVSRSKDG